ncbi:MAG: hypothetical protein WA843_00700 [Candidatus Saccharimonadales bacterium]
MPALFLTVLIVFVLLVLNEFWWRKRRSHGEISRKFIHLSVGSFVAFWPFFLSWDHIRLLSLAFLIGVAASKYLHVFRAIHSVQRPTWGELFFALAVGGITCITQDKLIYMAALLQMSLADGLAAVIGTRYGQKYRYIVFGHAKSLLGTLTFFLVSVGILIYFSDVSSAQLLVGFIVGLAAATSVIENLAARGLDNLLVPVIVACALRFLA